MGNLIVAMGKIITGYSQRLVVLARNICQ